MTKTRIIVACIILFLIMTILTSLIVYKTETDLFKEKSSLEFGSITLSKSDIYISLSVFVSLFLLIILYLLNS